MSAELKNVSYAEREKQVRQAKLFDEYKLFSQDAEKYKNVKILKKHIETHEYKPIKEISLINIFEYLDFVKEDGNDYNNLTDAEILIKNIQLIRDTSNYEYHALTFSDNSNYERDLIEKEGCDWDIKFVKFSPSCDDNRKFFLLDDIDRRDKEGKLINKNWSCETHFKTDLVFTLSEQRELLKKRFIEEFLNMMFMVFVIYDV